MTALCVSQISRKAHGRLSICVISTFSLSITVWGYEAKCVQLGRFHRGSISLQLNFTWTGSSPINHSWRQKTRDTGLQVSEDRIPLRSLVLTQYQSVTDRRTDML